MRNVPLHRSVVLILALAALFTISIAFSQTSNKPVKPVEPPKVCRHPSNGVERTIATTVFVVCKKRGQDCNAMAAQQEYPGNIKFIKGFENPFMRPFDANGRPNACDPIGNADTPCWALTQLEIYKLAPNPKCE